MERPIESLKKIMLHLEEFWCLEMLHGDVEEAAAEPPFAMIVDSVRDCFQDLVGVLPNVVMIM